MTLKQFLNTLDHEVWVRVRLHHLARAEMVKAFLKMSWALEEGSRLWFDRDSGTEVYEVKINDEGEAEVWENHKPPYERR